MKNYSAPKFELVVTLDNYCEGTIETENVSSTAVGNGGIYQVTLNSDPLKNLA